jgi:NAD(P)-dependent dehydrogenase (short-subunit alcohol dehydrogenase family)
LVEETVSAFGGVDILVNNGGTLMAAPTPEVDAGTFDRAFRLNVRSAFLLVGAAAPLMAKRGWGRIISISSVSGQRGSAGLALYGATKAALEQLTRAWAAEFGPRGVAVNCVAPGRVLTPFSEKNLGLSPTPKPVRGWKPPSPQDELPRSGTSPPRRCFWRAKRPATCKESS